MHCGARNKIVVLNIDIYQLQHEVILALGTDYFCYELSNPDYVAAKIIMVKRADERESLAKAAPTTATAPIKPAESKHQPVTSYYFNEEGEDRKEDQTEDKDKEEVKETGEDDESESSDKVSQKLTSPVTPLNKSSPAHSPNDQGNRNKEVTGTPITRSKSAAKGGENIDTYIQLKKNREQMK
jgi:hypothetical protein